MIVNRDELPKDLTTVVCIPTYNNEDSISSTLSLLDSQTHNPDRVVVCDKSEDRTPEMIKSFAAETELTIELIRQKGDGVAAAYNQILNHISGQYDIFLTFQTNISIPGDWLSNHLKIHAERPGIDLVTGDRLGNEDEGGVRTRPRECEVTPDQSPYYVGRNFSAKAGVLERIDGWDQNFLRGEDWDMRIRLAGAETRVYTTQTAGWEWQSGADDPTITFSKTKRRPTSLTFLAKYGTWYAKFHPSHIIGDGLSLLAVVFTLLMAVTFPFSPNLSVMSFFATVGCIVPYVTALGILRGGVDNSSFIRPVVKQYLVGVGVCYAARRLLRGDYDWNMAGFEPENIPRYWY